MARVEKGSAYVFKRIGTIWVEDAELTASDGAAYHRFGFSVSIDGDYAIIGAKNNDSAYVFVKSLTVPDLDCEGELNWTDVAPGDTVTGTFDVENIGGHGSLLNWEIESYPGWGDWTFNPPSGIGLKPEHGPFMVYVIVIAPDEPNTQFTGEVKIVNSDDPTDNCTIPVSLTITTTPIPDLDCDGNLDFGEVNTSSTCTSSFTVENIGDPSSSLDWEIESYPDWGTWTFTPSSGNDLTPEDGPVTVEVEVVAPNIKKTDFTGEVKIVNSDDPDDYCILDIILVTPTYSPFMQFIQNIAQRFPIFAFILDLISSMR
jgi:hypothetical protein